jgi:hypothetical protein
MNWEKEVEFEDGEKRKVVVTAGEIQDILISNLTRNEMDEFGGELIKCAERGSPLKFSEEWG